MGSLTHLEEHSESPKSHVISDTDYFVYCFLLYWIHIVKSTQSLFKCFPFRFLLYMEPWAAAEKALS